MGRNMAELISWRLVGNAFPALVRSSLACNCNAIAMQCIGALSLLQKLSTFVQHLEHSEDV